MCNPWSLDYFRTKPNIKSSINLFLVPIIGVAASLAWNYVGSLSANKKTHLFAVFTCGLFASGIDIDHFIAAGILNLQAATTLSERPFLHCTTIFTAFAVLLALFSIKMCSIPLLRLSLVITTAVWTHHWRDGYRRGIWVCPIGSTPPYWYCVYIAGLIALPLGLHFVLRFTSELIQKSKNKNLQAVYLI